MDSKRKLCFNSISILYNCYKKSTIMQPHLQRFLCNSFLQNLEGFKKYCAVKQILEAGSTSWSAGYEIPLTATVWILQTWCFTTFLNGWREGRLQPSIY